MERNEVMADVGCGALGMDYFKERPVPLNFQKPSYYKQTASAMGVNDLK
jgi:hypothetical protein